MDLNDYKPSDEVVILLKDPKTLKYNEEGEVESFEYLFNDDGSHMSITFYAPSTREFKKVITSVKKVVNTENLGEKDVVEVEDENIDLLYQLCTGWNIQKGGKKPKLTEDLFKTTLQNFFWIQPQVWDGFNKYEVFTPA